jgi:hypothetical protein
VLIHRAGVVPPGPWAATLQRPVTIGDIVATVGRVIPTPLSHCSAGTRGSL